MTNAGKIKLFDGTEVSSSGDEYRRQCMACHVLGFDPAERRRFFDRWKTLHGEEGLQRLRADALSAEPYYLLRLPNTSLRRRYLAGVESVRGKHIRSDLEARSLRIWEARRAEKESA